MIEKLTSAYKLQLEKRKDQTSSKIINCSNVMEYVDIKEDKKQIFDVCSCRHLRKQI